MHGKHNEQNSKPFLDRYAKPADDIKSELPERFYDPIMETLTNHNGCESVHFELTGSEITKVRTDPTSDEATDR